MTLIEFTEAIRQANWFGRISAPLPLTPFPPFQLTRQKFEGTELLPITLSEPEPFYPVGLHNRALRSGKMRLFRMATRRVYQFTQAEIKSLPNSAAPIARYDRLYVEERIGDMLVMERVISAEMRTAAATAMRWAAAEVVLEMEQFWLPIARVYWMGYRPIAVKDDWLIVE